MGQTLRAMDFGTVMIVVAVVARGRGGRISFWGSGRMYSGLGPNGGADHG